MPILNDPPTSFDILEGLQSDHSYHILVACQAVRELLSKEQNPSINHFFNDKAVPNLEKLLSSTDDVVRYEAAWTITKIAFVTSEQAHNLVRCKCIPTLINLLTSPLMNVREQAVWVLGEIARDGSELRDAVIQCGIVEKLLQLLRPDAANSFVRNVTWAMSNLCRHKNSPSNFEHIKCIFPALPKYLGHKDPEVVKYACWTLSYLTDSTNDKIQEVIDTGVVPRLVVLLDSYNLKHILPALWVIGNIVTGNDQQTQVILDSGALDVIRKLLVNNRLDVKKEATWMISNIAAGNPQQIQALIDAGIIELLLQNLIISKYNCQKEAAWAIANYTSGGTVKQILFLVQKNVIQDVCKLLNIHKLDVVLVLLDAINNILAAASRIVEVNVFLLIEKCDGLKIIKNLQKSENNNISRVATGIIEYYFL